MKSTVNETGDYVKRKGKETSPENTVKRIKNILHENGISVTETLYKSDVEGIWYCRITVDGFGEFLGSNGKGTTVEYCLASGYAELMERLQNCKSYYSIQQPVLQKLIDAPENDGSSLRTCKMDEISDLDDGMLDRFIEKTAARLGENPLIAQFKVIVALKESFQEFAEDKIQLARVWNYKKKEYGWISTRMLDLITGSSGMAAGNTLEEAIVQGASEIFERHVMKQVITKRLSMPDIPEEVLQQMPELYAIITRIRRAGYKVMVKDASLGQNYPVVCGIVINGNCQSAGVKFGSSPSLAIALERVFTEAMQGPSLEEFSHMAQITYDDDAICSDRNLNNIFSHGEGKYPPEILLSESDYPYIPWPDTKSLSNRQLCRQMIDRMASQCESLIIRDVSCLGFPSVHIYAEGFSETNSFDPPLQSLICKSGKVMCHIGTATDQELILLQNMIRYMMETVFLRSVGFLYNRIPLIKEPRGGDASLIALAYLTALKAHDEKNILAAFPVSILKEKEDPDTAYVKALGRICEAKAHRNTKGIQEITRMLCVDSCYQQLKEDLIDSENMLEHVYGHCCRPDCVHCSNPCLQPDLDVFYGKIFKKMRDSHVAVQGLHLIFSE